MLPQMRIQLNGNYKGRRVVAWVVVGTIVLLIGTSVLVKALWLKRARPGPWLEIDRTEINVGIVHSLAGYKATYKLANAGSEAVDFGKPTKTCWCIEPSLPTNSLAPRQKMIVELALKERPEKGPFLERVDLPTNDPRLPMVRLVVRGELRPVVAANPSHLVFDATRSGEMSSRKLELVSHDGQPFSIRQVDFDRTDFDVEYVKDVRGKSNRVQVIFHPSAGHLSRIDSTLIIRIEHPDLEQIIVPVRAEVGPDFVAIPPRLLALFCEPDGTCERAFEIEGPSIIAPEPKDVTVTDGPWKLLGWSRTPSESENRSRIEVVLKAPDRSGFHLGSLQVICEASEAQPKTATVAVRFGGIVRAHSDEQHNDTQANRMVGQARNQ